MEEDWSVDTVRKEVTVYTLSGKRFGRGKVYTTRNALRSRVLAGFTPRVSDLFA